MDEKCKKTSVLGKIFSWIGIIFCVILAPILITNGALIIKGYTNPDKVPSLLGKYPMIVMTDSMYPEIEGGDLIFGREVGASTVKVGDIISFYDPASSGKTVVTHRVTKIEFTNSGLYFTTKGDANNAEDVVKVPESKLVGIYESKIKGIGRVAMFMQTPLGIFVCIICPLLLLVAWSFINSKIKQENKGKFMRE